MLERGEAHRLARLATSKPPDELARSDLKGPAWFMHRNLQPRALAPALIMELFETCRRGLEERTGFDSYRFWQSARINALHRADLDRHTVSLPKCSPVLRPVRVHLGVFLSLTLVAQFALDLLNCRQVASPFLRQCRCELIFRDADRLGNVLQ